MGREGKNQELTYLVKVYPYHRSDIECLDQLVCKIKDILLKHGSNP